MKAGKLQRNKQRSQVFRVFLWGSRPDILFSCLPCPVRYSNTLVTLMPLVLTLMNNNWPWWKLMLKLKRLCVHSLSENEEANESLQLNVFNDIQPTRILLPAIPPPPPLLPFPNVHVYQIFCFNFQKNLISKLCVRLGNLFLVSETLEITFTRALLPKCSGGTCP